jgi:hypothetical protein
MAARALSPVTPRSQLLNISIASLARLSAGRALSIVGSNSRACNATTSPCIASMSSGESFGLRLIISMMRAARYGAAKLVPIK